MVRFAPVSSTVVTVYRDLRCGVTRITLAWDCDCHSDVLNAGGSISTPSSSSTVKGEYRLLLILECTDGDRGGVIVAVKCGGTGCHGGLSESDDRSPFDDIRDVSELMGCCRYISHI